MIQFHIEKEGFILQNTSERKSWIKQVIKTEGFSLGSINYILTSDQAVLKINQDYLKHDFYTDIITFDYAEQKVLSADIYISVDRVKENSEKLAIAFKDELDRVLIHGIIHLMGYQDKTPEDQAKMRAVEDKCLILRSQF